MPAPQAISAPGTSLRRVERCGGSARAPPASRGPCRAAPCPSPRRRRGRATRDSAGRRSCGPSRSPASSQGSCAGERVGHDVRGRVGDAWKRRRGARGKSARRGGACTARACRLGVGQRDASARSDTPASGHRSSAAPRQDCSPASASCTPLAPLQQVPRELGVSPTTMAQEQLPLQLGSRSDSSRCPGSPASRRRSRSVCGTSGFHTGFGVLTRDCVAAFLQPGDGAAMRAVDMEGRRGRRAARASPRTS